VEGERGELRVYLGAAPGVGKTFAMLGEGHRRAERGTDVVVGFIEDHDRPQTKALVAGLEVLPRVERSHRGATFAELDVAAVLARDPEIVLVDELAHTNVEGSAHPKRWQDVEEILDAGIDVVTTVNVQHLESLNDIVRSITGVEQRETVPDAVVRQATAIEYVDMSPEALRRRIAHGNVYASEKVDAALSHYFRVGNLTALRELALLWVADRVDDALLRYRDEHAIDHPWAARERVVVALTGGPEGEELVRNAARIAGRAAGGDLLAVYVALGDGMSGGSPAQLVTSLAGQRQLVESLGGTFHTAVGEDVAAAILDFANGVNATQIVIGLSRRSRLAAVFSPGVGERVIDGSGDIDVHVVTHAFTRGAATGGTRPRIGTGQSPRGRRTPALPRNRRVLGWAVAVAAPLLLTGALTLSLSDSDLSLHLMLFLAVTVAVALIGGLAAALASAVLGGCASTTSSPSRGSVSPSTTPPSRSRSGCTSWSRSRSPTSWTRRPVTPSRRAALNGKPTRCPCSAGPSSAAGTTSVSCWIRCCTRSGCVRRPWWNAPTAGRGGRCARQPGSSRRPAPLTPTRRSRSVTTSPWW